MSNTKRPYQRPRVELVPLKSEEVVLGACKSATGTGTSGPGSQGNCRMGNTPCSALGS
jgi:hypothetical protein